MKIKPETDRVLVCFILLGCRRVREERPSFSINTTANECVARFLQDTTKSELHLFDVEKEKLSQLAALYYLDLWSEDSNSWFLRKTNKTPHMQQPQRHHAGNSAGHKRIRTLHHTVSCAKTHANAYHSI